MKKNESDWVEKGLELYVARRLKKAAKCFAKAVQINPNFAPAFKGWGLLLTDLAHTKKDEALGVQSFEKFAEATQLNPNYAEAFYNWGNALSDLAEIKKDGAVFVYLEAYDKFAEADRLNHNSAKK